MLSRRNTHIHPFPSSLVSWLEAAAAIFAGAKTFRRNLKVIDRVHLDTSTFLTFLTYTVHVTLLPTSLHPPYHSASMPVSNVDAHQLRHVRQEGGA